MTTLIKQSQRLIKNTIFKFYFNKLKKEVFNKKNKKIFYSYFKNQIIKFNLIKNYCFMVLDYQV